jgi:hypothetical protein
VADDSLRGDALVLLAVLLGQPDDGLGQDRGGGRAVAGLVGRADGGVAGHLHHAVSDRVVEPQAAEHGDAVLGEERRQVVLVALDEDDPPAGAEGATDRLRDLGHCVEDDGVEFGTLHLDPLGNGFDLRVIHYLPSTESPTRSRNSCE